jgi:hypothetical protein
VLHERVRELEARAPPFGRQRGGESVCGAATDGGSIVPPEGPAAVGVPGGRGRGGAPRDRGAIAPPCTGAGLNGYTPGSAEQPMVTGPRDVQIRQLAVLKAAASFLAVRSSSEPADVLQVAAQWELWVARGNE